MTITYAELRLLAAQRVRRGEQLQRQHEPDGVGCCRRCGRSYPCDGRRLGVALVEYYRRLAVIDSGSTLASASDRRMFLVRIASRCGWWKVRHARR